MEKILLPHLNTQTNSNLSFSFLTIPQLVDWASNNKLNYLAIADYYPYEITEFFNLCKAKKIKPIWGVKIFLQEKPAGKKFSATLYPQNNKGYKEVIQKLFAPDSPPDRSFSPVYILSTFSKNCLIVLEAQKIEEIKYLAAQWILTRSPQKEVNYENIFLGFNFFLLSPSQSIPSQIISRLLPFFAVKCLSPEEVKLLGLWKKTNFQRYFFLNDTSGEFTPYLNTADYFSRCTDDSTFYQLLLIQWQTFLTKIKLNPSFRSEKLSEAKKESALLLLKSKCWQKLIALKKEKETQYQQTLTEELKVIAQLNYADYFLIFSDVAQHLRAENIIVGPGRGSAVASLVAYLLGITQIDPLEHKLFFARFLNEKRKSLPDIDLDVENQDEVFNYLQKKYSKKQVARIITRKKTGWKVALREIAKLYRIDEIKLKEITSLTGENPDFSKLKLQKWQTAYPALFKLAEKIQNLYYDTGIHPAGVVISTGSLVGLVPLKAEKDYLLTLFEENKLAELGLKKYDFLSLRETLGFIREARSILSTSLPDYQKISLTDQKTWDNLKNFLLTGIFQLDTPSARTLFNRFRPQSFADLVIFLSLNRPGTRKKAEELSQNKNNNAKIGFTSPAIREILTETYGHIIFEEQISQILVLVYDCSFAEAEVKRRELPEKGLPKDFLTQAQRKMTLTESKLIYQQINSSLGYTFNKAHAVAYSYLTYYIAYLKANFLPKLITYFLNKRKEKELFYLQEAFFCGFQIKGPDINHSELEWIKKDSELLMGFSNLKGYQPEFFQALITERKKGGIYKNWEDLIARTLNYWEKVEAGVFEIWVKSGLFNSLGLEIDNLLSNQAAIFRYLSIRKRLVVVNNSLPFLHLATEKSIVNKALINQREFESLGLYVSYFSRWNEVSKGPNGVVVGDPNESCRRPKELATQDYKIYSLSAVLQKIEEYDNKETSLNIYAIICGLEKKSESNYILSLQDIRNAFQLNISSNFYQKNKENLVIHSELLFTLKIGVKRGKINSLVCESIRTF
ncbi:DNA polymerase III (alpha subunit) [endosymbiont DhMRE of Dentiscutata heterogama]|uniref:helix-hairpin-helix domain-containing protein n=1 Tax=endosymbiont DhMRE of Dentiscutata heterogama TaxID=1609546 RepID=UPI000629D7C4|nr:PHP domain-containing protein [endosymbiont DhMRE of Dentiscutata heterogama]CFW92797.1 DNA polymerase III (alpha subunit) [endosymbiont DhMRE of Dentiscutata heterogama]